MENIKSITRDIPIDRLVVDPRLASLFVAEPQTIGRIARSIRANGYDSNRPIDVWKDGAGRGRHVVVEGHQRLQAARAAGQTEIRVAFRHFDDDTAALLWAAEQQANRRNASKEAQCLSILRALRDAGDTGATTAQLSERFGFSTATIDRARQVLRRGTDSEVMAVMEGQHGLRTAYDLILKRERGENEALRSPEPRQPSVADEEIDLDLEIDPGPDIPEELARARDVLHDIDGRVGRLQDILLAENANDIRDDIRDNRVKLAVDELTGLLEDLVAATEALR